MMAGEQNVASGSWLWNDPGGDPGNQYDSHDHIINALPQLHILLQLLTPLVGVIVQTVIIVGLPV